jgi:ketosteroid isomerase-like protein
MACGSEYFSSGQLQPWHLSVRISRKRSSVTSVALPWVIHGRPACHDLYLWANSNGKTPVYQTAVCRVIATVVMSVAPAVCLSQSDVLQGVRASWEVAMVRADANAAAALFDEGAVQLRPGRPTNHGRAAIAASYREDLAHSRVSAVKLTPSRTEEMGDAALEHGTFRITWVDRSDASKSIELHGRYLLVARRIGGVWKLTMEMHTVESSVPEEQLR